MQAKVDALGLGDGDELGLDETLGLGEGDGLGEADGEGETLGELDGEPDGEAAAPGVRLTAWILKSGC